MTGGNENQESQGAKLMPYPDEYNSWVCCRPEEVHPGRDCEAVWQVCEECDNHLTDEGTDCDSCSGSGGGHTCLYELEEKSE